MAKEQKSMMEQLKELEAADKAATIEEVKAAIGEALISNTIIKDGILDMNSHASWRDLPEHMQKALMEPDVSQAAVAYAASIAAALQLLYDTPIHEWVCLDAFQDLMPEHKLLMHGRMLMLRTQPKGFEPNTKPVDDEVDLADQSVQPQPQPQSQGETMSFDSKTNPATEGTTEHVKSVLGTANTLGERVAQQARHAYSAVPEAQVHAPSVAQAFEPREIAVSFTARPQSLKDKALDVAYFLGIGVVLGVGYSAGKRLFEHFVGDGATSDDQAPEVPEAFM